MNTRLAVMNRPLLAATALVLAAATSASAADIGAVSVPAFSPIPVYNWTGFYVGGHLGGGWADLQSTVVSDFSGLGAFSPGTTVDQTHPTGFLGGLQGGFDYQFSQWVLGYEADYSWSDLTGSSTTQSAVKPLISSTTSAKISEIALISGRLGYVWSNFLFYVKGGGAWDQGNANGQVLSGGALMATTFSGADRYGWTFGGGAEWGFWGNWSAKVEYNHIDFDTKTISTVANSGVLAERSSTHNTSETIDVFKAGLNYRFSWLRVI